MKKNRIFKWRILVYFIFLSDGGAPNVAGPGVTYPLVLPFSAGLYLSDNKGRLIQLQRRERTIWIQVQEHFGLSKVKLTHLSADIC